MSLREVPSIRPYMSIKQLAELSPWSPAAIDRMISRGIFQLNVHYFRPTGPRGERVFKWAAIAEFVEREAKKLEAATEPPPPRRRKSIDVDQVESALQRLRPRAA